MKFGAVFPTTEIGSDPIAIRDWAQAAEQLGYDHMITYDHVLGAEHAKREPALAGPYTEHDAFHEPMVLLGYLAGLTTKLGLATGVMILPQRQAALVAKQAAEIDVLSSGRLRLGVGTGWNWVEYESLGATFEDRGARFDEQVELLRKLWREPLVDYDGRYHRVARANILPLPRPDLPLWFGGFSPVALRRAARTGDGFIFGTTATRMRGMLETLRALVASEGRDPDTFGAEAICDFSQPRGEWAREVESWREGGGSHISLRAMDTAAEFVGAKRVGFSGPSAYIDALEAFKAEISW
jgi:probable F420-dependent oxidoreductase